MKYLFYYFLFIVFFFTSCKTYKNIPYFQDLSDSARISVLKAPYQDLRIQPDDILSITIQTVDPAGNAVFNQASPSTYVSQNPSAINGSLSASAAASVSQPLGGYLVNKQGDIDLPMLGTFHVAGLTTLAAQDSIAQRTALYYKSPTVLVRFSNFKVTVLGEVNRPGSYVIPNERVTIFDALGLAGDLTIFGKRENVLLVRDSANQSQLVRLNLNSKDIVSSSYFYLRQNDVLYIEPLKEKIANLDASKNRNYAIAGALLSVLIIAATRIK
ncbi:MAG TPA: polysaccharide biosynthesis/export family protein [Chitinophagaceae bacterium]|nr:polysaccharide biosynthesis/export family protein [Chitinophagaceae bacterium]